MTDGAIEGRNHGVCPYVLFFAAVLALLATGCEGPSVRKPDRQEAAPARPVPPQYICLEASGEIIIDGRLDEEAWQHAVRAAIATRHNASGQRAGRPVGHFRMLHSPTALYIALEVFDHDIRAEGKERDQAGTNPQSDLVLLFIDINGDDEHFLEFHLNPLNAFNDRFVLRPNAASPLNERIDYGMMFFPGFDLDVFDSAVSIDGTVNEPGDTDTGWTAEIMLPFESLKMPAHRPRPAEGESWRVQVALQTGVEMGHRYHVWAPSFNPWHQHSVDHWGIVVFSAAR